MQQDHGRPRSPDAHVKSRPFGLDGLDAKTLGERLDLRQRGYRRCQNTQGDEHGPKHFLVSMLTVRKMSGAIAGMTMRRAPITPRFAPVVD